MKFHDGGLGAVRRLEKKAYLAFSWILCTTLDGYLLWVLVRMREATVGTRIPRF